MEDLSISIDSRNKIVIVRDPETWFSVEINYYIEDNSFSHHFGTEYIYTPCVDCCYVKDPDGKTVNENEDYPYDYDIDDRVIITPQYMNELIDKAYNLFEKIDNSELIHDSSKDVNECDFYDKSEDYDGWYPKYN